MTVAEAYQLAQRAVLEPSVEGGADRFESRGIYEHGRHLHLELAAAGDRHVSSVCWHNVQHEPATAVLELRARGVALGQQLLMLLGDLAHGIEDPSSFALHVGCDPFWAVKLRSQRHDHLDTVGGHDDAFVGGLGAVPYCIRYFGRADVEGRIYFHEVVSVVDAGVEITCISPSRRYPKKRQCRH